MSTFAEGFVERIVKAIGIEVVEHKGDELVAPCPMHEAKTGRPDRNPSWSINEDTGLHYCFSCKSSGNLHTLVAGVVGRERVRDFLGSAPTDLLPAPEQEVSYSRHFSLPRPPKPRTPLAESRLAMYEYPPDWALTVRRLRRGSVQKFGVLWDTPLDAWVLPLRDSVSHYLIGYQIKYQKERRMLNQPPGMDKSSTLFGICEAEGAEEVVLVESPLDAVLLDGFGVTAVALCGSRMSQRQAGLLAAFDTVVLALDNDDAGRKETNRIVRSGPGFMFRLAKYPKHGKDFGEMKKNDILTAIEI
jgi:Toprim domain-containing protein/CHC2-type zinc finger protein